MTEQEVRAEMRWILMLLRNGEGLSDEEWATLAYFFEKGIDAEFKTKTTEEA